MTPSAIIQLEEQAAAAVGRGVVERLRADVPAVMWQLVLETTIESADFINAATRNIGTRIFSEQLPSDEPLVIE
jgi:hypothetical protein